MTIKTGDLVMLVRPTPCCGNVGWLGTTGTISIILRRAGRCAYCGKVSERTVASLNGLEGSVSVERLKKIDPPADGDSLPTRADIEVAA